MKFHADGTLVLDHEGWPICSTQITMKQVEGDEILSIPTHRGAEAQAVWISNCLNACAGMDDPAAEIARLRERALDGDEARAIAAEKAVDRFLSAPFEVAVSEDSTAPDYFDGEMPVARIRWHAEAGDWSVGIPEWAGFCLDGDQSGTAVGALLAERDELRKALERTLSWLTSYPGGVPTGPGGVYEQARAALGDPVPGSQ